MTVFRVTVSLTNVSLTEFDVRVSPELTVSDGNTTNDVGVILVVPASTELMFDGDWVDIEGDIQRSPSICIVR